ncbi:CLIP-associating protein 1/2 [Elysia marginata]|uniref:CLIP-associating protein 1/2 n=1 Tax=Elysia marginata TaxID=1093978 RepID=A0AAV4F7L9_9GAST|nr:CLIP-associating protein 1/2 [Elysia marginata]
MQKMKDVLSDSTCMWEKRIDNCKMLRALLISGAADYDDFFHSLRTLESAFIMVVKDLRSQVVREGCITIAYLSQQLGSKFDHFAEAVLPSLLNLIPNSAKVMSTSGMVCIRFIMQFVHTNRLIPIICGSTTSKSNIIRRACLEFVNQLLHSWPTHCLEKHIALLQESIKRGISDADSEARVHSRKAFWGFADHFKSQADALLNSLDASKQKLLQGEVSNSSSSSSLNNGDHHQTRPRARSRAASEERSGLGGGVSSGYGYSSGTSTLRKAAQRISSSKSDAGVNLQSVPFPITTSYQCHDAPPRCAHQHAPRTRSGLERRDQQRVRPAGLHEPQPALQHHRTFPQPHHQQQFQRRAQCWRGRGFHAGKGRSFLLLQLPDSSRVPGALL